MNSHWFSCPICYISYSPLERDPKICLCGQTYCSYCINQSAQHCFSRCPFCRLDLAINYGTLDQIPTNRVLRELIEGKCQFHSELKTLLCLTCKTEVCSACIYVEKEHIGHKIIHICKVPEERLQLKEKLWESLDSRKKYQQAMTPLLENFTKIVLNKLIGVKGKINKKTEKDLLSEANLFFSEKENMIKETFEKDKELILAVKEQLAILDNPSIDEEYLGALGTEVIKFNSEKQYALLTTDILDFRDYFDEMIDLALSQDLNQNLELPSDFSDTLVEENASFGMMKSLNYEEQRLRKLGDISIESCEIQIDPSIKEKNTTDLFMTWFKSKQSNTGSADNIYQILNQFKNQEHALMDLLFRKIPNTGSFNLLSLHFWLNGVILFEMNFAECKMSEEETVEFFSRVLPQLRALQEVNLDFKGTGIKDNTLKEFQNNTLSELKKLTIFKFDLNGTRATNEGVSWILKKIQQIGRDFYIQVGSEEICSEDLAGFIKTAFENDDELKRLVTSYEVRIFKGTPKQRNSFLETFYESVSENSGCIPVLNSIEAPDYLNTKESETHESSSTKLFYCEEMGYKLLLLRFSQKIKNVGFSATNTTYTEAQNESTRIEN